MQEQSPTPVYYQPPVEHQKHLNKMFVWLTIFFSFLLISTALFVYFADRILVHLPFSAEKRFVRPYEEIAKRFSSQQKSQEETIIQEYLDALVAGLVENINLDPEIEIEVHYLDSDAINAFATLGGHIFVCKGLLEKIPDENSLAMVLSHEIAHVKHRDPIAGMARGLAIQMIYSYVSGDYRASDIAGYSSEIGLLYFSREQERKADLEAVRNLNMSYGHVAGLDSIFKLIRAESENDESETGESESPNWLSSHPDLDERIDYLTSFARQNNWSTKEVNLIPVEVKQALAKYNKDKIERNLLGE